MRMTKNREHFSKDMEGKAGRYIKHLPFNI